MGIVFGVVAFVISIVAIAVAAAKGSGNDGISGAIGINLPAAVATVLVTDIDSAANSVNIDSNADTWEANAVEVFRCPAGQQAFIVSSSTQANRAQLLLIAVADDDGNYKSFMTTTTGPNQQRVHILPGERVLAWVLGTAATPPATVELATTIVTFTDTHEIQRVNLYNDPNGTSQETMARFDVPAGYYAVPVDMYNVPLLGPEMASLQVVNSTRPTTDIDGSVNYIVPGQSAPIAFSTLCPSAALTVEQATINLLPIAQAGTQIQLELVENSGTSSVDSPTVLTTTLQLIAY